MFYKSYRQQFNSSIARDPMKRAVFNDLCALSDRDGNVDMDYESIAAITRWPIETIVSKIGDLMQPDPDSRTKRCDGARLVLIDAERPWGWRIVNYELFRNMRSNDDRRHYMRDLMRNRRRRESRRKLAPVSTVSTVSKSLANGPKLSQDVPNVSKVGGHVSNVLAAHVVNPASHNDLQNKPVSKALAGVSRRYQPLAQAEADTYTEVPSAVSLKGRQLQAHPDLVTDYWEAKTLICEHILNHKDPNRLWSVDADKRLLKHLPIPRLEIERVAWFRGMPNDGSPELEARKDVTETGLMAYWGDEVTRANAFWQKIYGWREKKKAAG
jgi:hypothetical protein